jgi:hypothetical protein
VRREGLSGDGLVTSGDEMQVAGLEQPVLLFAFKSKTQGDIATAHKQQEGKPYCPAAITHPYPWRIRFQQHEPFVSGSILRSVQTQLALHEQRRSLQIG